MTEEPYKPRQGQSIERLYAWVATELDGGEGICAATLQSGGMIPLVGADRARIESLRPHAELAARFTGCPVRLIEFQTRRQIGEPIDPGK